MDMFLTAEQDAVRKAVHEWVDDVVVPRALSNDRDERFPQEALDGLKQTGFVGIARNEQTHEPTPYMESLPESLAGRPVFVLDPLDD